MNRAEILNILTRGWGHNQYHKDLAQHFICQIEEELGDVLHRCQQELRQVYKSEFFPQEMEETVHPLTRIMRNDLREWVRRDINSTEGRRIPEGKALYNKVWEIVNKDLPEEERQELEKLDKWDKYLTNLPDYFDEYRTAAEIKEEATYPFLHTMTLVLIYLFLGMWYPATEMKALSNDAGASADAAETPSDIFNQRRNASGNTQWVDEAFNIARENGWLEGDTPPFRWKKQQQALCYFIACAFSRQEVKLLPKEAQDFAKIFGENYSSMRAKTDELSKKYPLANVRSGNATNAPESIKEVVYTLTR